MYILFFCYQFVLVSILLFVLSFNMYLFGCPRSLLQRGGSSSLTWDQTWTPALGAQSLSHWAAREVPAGSHFSREGTAAGVSCEESCTSQPQRGRPNAQIHRSWRSLGAGGRRGGARVREGGARVRRDQAHPPSPPQLPYHRAPARGDP